MFFQLKTQLGLYRTSGATKKLADGALLDLVILWVAAPVQFVTCCALSLMTKIYSKQTKTLLKERVKAQAILN